ncbi:MAG TPA: hypothetical protein VG298_08770 [Acidimicrobiales bacterium]|jgi:hypothetical protein|nr:hypothetical protein [Acidimicrobiales bacterium]
MGLTPRRHQVALVSAALLAVAALVSVVSVAPARVTPAAAATAQSIGSSPVPAYWLVASDGGIFSFGGAPYYGSTGAVALNKPIVGMAATPDSGGYWLVASDGGIFSFGDGIFHGSTGSIKLNKPIVGMAATPDGGGYWLVASDGGIFSFGDAKFWGSTGSLKLNKPIVGMAATPDGGGYWLVASDGGIFSFGDAKFWGSTGSIALNKPIIGMMSAPNGAGYILVASDGGTFSFGTAPFFGSLGGIPLKNPIVTAAATPGDSGYWFSDVAGSVSAFGQASYYGSAPTPLNRPIVGMAEAPGTGAFVGAAYPSGSFGYDVSKFNMNSSCSSGLPSGVHDIGVVEVDGESSGAANPCLAAEAGWAGAGLNLYTFLDNVMGSALCSDPTSCFTTGFNAGQHAFQDAQAAGVNTNVAWWLDVEGSGLYWTSSTANNVQTILGAMAALHNTDGVADVGIYASPGVWNSIVGNYQPSAPYWMADWLNTPSGPGTCGDVANQRAKHQLPTGPVNLVQYGDNINGADGDYAC